jgi:hypothetical protein
MAMKVEILSDAEFSKRFESQPDLSRRAIRATVKKAHRLMRDSDFWENKTEASGDDSDKSDN